MIDDDFYAYVKDLLTRVHTDYKSSRPMYTSSDVNDLLTDPDEYAVNTTGFDADRSVINGYDLGDLLTEIDDQIGQAVERTAHRYVPRPIAQDLRRRIVKQVADYAINHDRQLET